MNEFDKMSVKRNEEKERKKKVILTGIAICIVLIIILAVMIIYYKKVDEKTFKLYINDVQSEFGEGFCITNDEGETYVRARDIASYIKWSYQNGEYGCGVIGKIVNVSAEESIMTNNNVDINLLDAIAFDPYTHGYYKVNTKVGNAFKDGLSLKK